MLGGLYMSASNAPDCAESARPSLARAQQLLEEALQIIDQLGSHPELGARLQEVIDDLKSLTD